MKIFRKTIPINIQEKSLENLEKLLWVTTERYLIYEFIMKCSRISSSIFNKIPNSPKTSKKTSKKRERHEKLILTWRVPVTPHFAMHQCVRCSPMVLFVKTLQATPLKACSCTCFIKRPRLGNHWFQSYRVLFMAKVVYRLESIENFRTESNEK